MTAAGYAVVIITRDRPSYLKQFIKALDQAIRANGDIQCHGVAIVDDSVDRRSRVSNAHSLRTLMKNAPHRWIDREVQEKLTREAGFVEVRGLLRPLGSRHWCVGGARNTGALYWLTSNPCPQVIAFFDDDLLPIDRNHEWLHCLVSKCGRSGEITGARITGMQDESRLESIHRRLLSTESLSIDKAIDDRHEAYPISGGCMVVPSELMKKNCFPLVYNEDWILCLEFLAEDARVCLLPDPLLWQRMSRDKISMRRLQQEAIGGLAYRTMLRLHPAKRRLESIVEEEELWAEERSRYCREVLDVHMACVQVKSCGDRLQDFELGALSVWVSQVPPTQDSFSDHGLARASWCRILERHLLRENPSGRLTRACDSTDQAPSTT